MALSDRAKDALRIALAQQDRADEVISMIESGANPVASAVSAIGTTSDIGTTNGSGGAGDAALATDVETRLDQVEAKVDEVIAALKNAGLMQS
jgi:hypothetical protein